MKRRSLLFPLSQQSHSTSNSQRGHTDYVAPEFAMRTEAGLEPWSPSSGDVWDFSKAAHLLRRSMVGPTPSEIRQAVQDGLETTLNKLFTSFEPSVADIQEIAGQDPQIRPASTDAATVQAWQTLVNKHKDMLRRWRAKTIAQSPVSLQEKLITFWSNHFTSELQVVNFAQYMYTQELLIRTFMLGNFHDFTYGITIDPAMLIYLDGRKNFVIGKRNQINENYARELMELFTCGVYDWDGKPNYSEDDVAQAARGLSGWDIKPSEKGNLYASLVSQFNELRWDSGDKTLMGKKGKWKTKDIVDIVFAERKVSIARYICTKIYREFVYDIPDKVIVEQMSQTFMDSQWNIRSVIEQLLRSKHFFAAENIGAKHKSPIEFFIGAVRGLGLKNIVDFDFTRVGRQTQLLLGMIDGQGQTLFDPPNVKGWEGGRTWTSTSTLPQRQKWMMDIMDGKIRSGAGAQQQTVFVFDAIAFAKQFSAPNDLKTLTREMAEFLLNVSPSDAEFTVLFDTILDGGKDYEWNIDDAAQRPDARIRKFIKAAAELAKFQLT